LVGLINAAQKAINYCIVPGAVAAAGQNTYSFYVNFFVLKLALHFVILSLDKFKVQRSMSPSSSVLNLEQT
jgi:hypothetical protein